MYKTVFFNCVQNDVYFGTEPNCRCPSIRSSRWICRCPDSHVIHKEFRIKGVKLVTDEDASHVGSSLHFTVPCYSSRIWVIRVCVPAETELHGYEEILHYDSEFCLDAFYTPYEKTANVLVETLYSKLDKYVEEEKTKRYGSPRSIPFDDPFKTWLEDAAEETPLLTPLLPLAAEAIDKVSSVAFSFYAEFVSDTGERSTPTFYCTEHVIQK